MSCHVVFDTLALALVLQDIATTLFVLILAVICIVVIGVVYYFDRTALQLDIADVAVGQLLIVGGALFYFTCGSGECYWWAHSLWHTSVALGLALLVEGRNPFWNMVNFLTCGRCCIPRDSTSNQLIAST
jgi:hypothetical protein